jgi:sortase A
VPTGSAPSDESNRQGIVGTVVLFALLFLTLLYVPYSMPTEELPVAPPVTVPTTHGTPTATCTPSLAVQPSATRAPTLTSEPSPSVTPPLATEPSPSVAPSRVPQSPTPTATPLPSRIPATSGPERIVIPSIDLDAAGGEVGWKVVEENGVLASQWEVADYAVGFHRGSAYPGHVGNTVLSGHHNIRGEVFRYLHLVEPGDDVYLYVGIQGYHYVVEAKYRFLEKGVPPDVKRDNAKWIQHTEDERLTLVTCWPYSGNSHRIVVVAKPE